MRNEVIQGDFRECSKQIEPGAVDLVLTDPPYGTIKNAELDGWNTQTTNWDKAIKPTEIYEVSERILRKNGKLILFSQDPYTTKLINKAINNLPFCYRMIWFKDHFANGLIAKDAPVNYFEDILVFKKEHDTRLNHPLRKYFKEVLDCIGKTKSDIIKEIGQKADHTFRFDSSQFSLCTKKTYQELIENYKIDEMNGFKEYSTLKEIDKEFSSVFNLPKDKKHKPNVLEYKKDYDNFHPTQKPLDLIKDLVKTYSNPSDFVVDLTSGSGTTAVACKELDREFLCFEKKEKYVDIANERLNKTTKELSKFG